MAAGRRHYRYLLAAGLIVALAVAALYALAAHALQGEHRARLAAALEADARRLAGEVAVRWAATPSSDSTPCPVAGTLRVRIVRPGDAPACLVGGAEAPDDAALAAARRAALGGRAVLSEAAPDRLAMTVPVRSGAGVVAALQAVLTPLPEAEGLAPLRIAFIGGAAGLALAMLGLWWLRATAVRRRASSLVVDLHRLASGQAVQPPVTGDDPLLEPLASELEQAAAAVRERLQRLTQQLDEREAVLASMVEGVLAVEPSGRLLNLNAAAGRMFAIEPAAARGRDLLEVVRQPELQRFVREALASPVPLESELTLFGPEPRTLQAHGTALRDPHGHGLGTLVVLNDVTHLRRLERMRQDFVANVSHEIKTPITSIKGFVETLLDGALDDGATARRFLEIVARHAERLNAITEDLLNLSRIEQEAERGALHTEEASLAGVLRAAVQVCAAKADAKGTRLAVDCAESLRARLNAQLVEQAVVNLVDNAVKYAPAGTEVRVEGAREPAGVVVRVRDQGPGIPAEHLPRLFERFYRVDKARSRKAGGTGLGLAIVKHIAQAHDGRVEVQSELGSGSTFSLHLPDVPPTG
jgi:two-component system phosphate regulon sensor histidine kinase PhoR